MTTNTFSIGVRILSPPSSAADKRRRLRMFRAMGAAVVAIILLIVVIGVYVSSSGGRCLAPSGICTSTPTRRQVFILRHCVRSTTTVVKYGVPHVTNASAYTNISLPPWGVPVEWCTPGGLALLEGTGAYLVSSGAVPAHTSLSVVSDTVQRDVDSANALMRGMRRSEPVILDAQLFDTLKKPDVGTPLCNSTETSADRARAARQRMLDTPFPADFNHSTSLLERLIGVGSAGPFAPMGPPTLTSDGKLTGAIGPLKLFAQNLFYSFASNVPYAWQPSSTSSSGGSTTCVRFRR